VAATLLTGCAANQEHDLDAIAAAKCALPVAQRLLPGQNAAESAAVQSDEGVQTEVRRLAHRRREVTGSVIFRGASHAYVCVVAPDARDKLRHLRVVRLDVDMATASTTSR
jgi:hypothetical protein